MVVLLSRFAFSTADAAVPFVIDDGDTLDPGHVEVDLGFQSTSSGKSVDADWPYVEGDLGLANGLELDVVAPVAAAREPDGWFVGPGDIEIAPKIRVVTEDDGAFRPAVSVQPTLTIPTGSSSHGLGSGHLGLCLPVWASEDVGAYSVFAGAAWTLPVGAARRSGVLLGGGLTAGLGGRWRVGGELTFTVSPERQEASGAAFDLDLLFDVGKAEHVFLSVGRGLTNTATSQSFSGFLGVQLDF